MRIWRISNFADLSGRGGTLIEGRWHRRGVHIVYCTDHPSTALLEILVHATRQTVPDIYQLIEIDIPDDVRIARAEPIANWEKNPEKTQNLGMSFLATGAHALMRIPSATMPKADNYLLNPLHEDAHRITIAGIYRYPFDSRLLK